MVVIRTDPTRKFDHDKSIDYCDKNDIFHNFSEPRTPQQNGVVERKNKALEDMAVAFICENDPPKSL